MLHHSARRPTQYTNTFYTICIFFITLFIICTIIFNFKAQSAGSFHWPLFLGSVLSKPKSSYRRSSSHDQSVQPHVQVTYLGIVRYLWSCSYSRCIYSQLLSFLSFFIMAFPILISQSELNTSDVLFGRGSTSTTLVIDGKLVKKHKALRLAVFTSTFYDQQPLHNNFCSLD